MQNKRIVTLSAKHSIVEDVPMPELTDDNILVRQTFVGVCMSEHYDWSIGKNKTFGHEPVGVVVEVGDEVKNVKVGDRVIMSKYSGTEVKLDGQEYTILRQGDILAIVE